MTDNTDNLKREAMIEMLEALDVALQTRAIKWLEEAKSVPKLVLSPREAKANRGHVLECKIRVDEIEAIRKLITATIETCKQQNTAGMTAEQVEAMADAPVPILKITPKEAALLLKANARHPAIGDGNADN